jgi:hypothetical protein
MNEKDQQSIGSGEITPATWELLIDNEKALVAGMIRNIWNWPKNAIMWLKTIVEFWKSDLWPLKDMWWELINSRKYKNQIQVKNWNGHFFISSNLDARFTSVLSKDPEIIATCSDCIVTLDFADKHNETNKNYWKFITWKSDSWEIDSEIYDIAEKLLKQWFSWKLEKLWNEWYKIWDNTFDGNWDILTNKIDPETLYFLHNISRGFKPDWDDDFLL